MGTTHPAGSARGGLRQPFVPPRRASRGRGALILVLAAWWVLGLVALEGGRLSSFQMIAVAVVGLAIHWLAGAHRRRTELTRARPARSEPVTPRTCVVLRRFGEAGDETPQSPWSRN